MKDSRALFRMDLRRIFDGNRILAPIAVLMKDPRPLGLPEPLAAALASFCLLGPFGLCTDVDSVLGDEGHPTWGLEPESPQS